MLWTIFVILLALWLLGMISSYTMGGFIHLLLVLAIVVVLIRVIQDESRLLDTRAPRFARSSGSAVAKAIQRGDRSRSFPGIRSRGAPHDALFPSAR